MTALAPRRLRALTSSTVSTSITAIVGGIHLAVAHHHGLVTTHGAFFLAVGLAQSVIALALARRSDPRRLSAAIALNTGTAAIWLAVHVPTAMTGERVTGLGLTATTLEVTAALFALMALRDTAPLRAPLPRPGILGLTGLVALALTVTASTDTGHTHRHDDPADVAEPATRAPIFGDLFSDHHHDAPIDAPADPAERHDH